MSNLWFNIRFGIHHWQFGPNGSTWTKNPYAEEAKRRNENWKRFEVFTLFGIEFV
jgi:hypothetical protein